MGLTKINKGLLLAIGFFVFGLITIYAPLNVEAALQNETIADFPETNGEVYAIATSSDGSVYIGGTFSIVDGVSRRNIARILNDNTVDPDFNPNIFEGGDGFDVIRALAINESASTLYVGGGFDFVNGSTLRNNLAAINSQTGLATSFNPNVNGIVYTLELNESGDTLYAGGSFTAVNGGTSRKDLAAFSTSTSIATAFDADINTVTCDEGAETVYDLLLDANTSRLYIAGHFYSVRGNYSPGLAAIDPISGVHDEEFIPNIRYSGDDADLGQCPDVYSVEKVGSTIYAGGFFDNVNSGSETRTNFAAFDASTGIATDLDMAFDYTVYDLAIDPIDGNLYLGGSFSMVNGSTERNEVAAIDLNTNELSSFNPNITTAPPEPSVHAITFGSRGYFYAGGSFDHVGGVPRVSLSAFANTDPDNDGIVSEVEDAAPNDGDGNNDGTPDAEQTNVASFISDETSQYVTVVAPEGAIVSTVSGGLAPGEDEYTHFYDLVGFKVEGLTPGDTIEVTVIQQNPDNIDAAQLTARKYFPSTTSYKTISSSTVTNEIIGGQPVISLTFDLIDGGEYDLDGLANGEITDPVSLAADDAEAGTLADTGQSSHIIIVVATLLITCAFYFTKKARTAWPN
jgi:hypothetical protein